MTEAEIAGLGSLHATLNAHTLQDQENFERLSVQISVLDDKVDQLLLREARREGKADGVKWAAAKMAGVVSALITVVGIAAQAFLG